MSLWLPSLDVHCPHSRARPDGHARIDPRPNVPVPYSAATPVCRSTDADCGCMRGLCDLSTTFDSLPADLQRDIFVVAQCYRT